MTALCESTTVCVMTGDCEPVNLESPEYAAVNVCVPLMKPATVIVALPFMSTAPEPKLVEPSMKVTEPLTPDRPPAAVTAADRSTEEALVVGFCDVAMTIDGAALSTTWTNAGEPAAKKLASPP